MTDLVRLIYFSRNAIPLSGGDMDHEIERILAVSRRNNARCGITGALIYNQGVFGQVLEGPAAAVEDTYDRIQCDDRHTATTILDLVPVPGRSFGDWSMGFVGAGPGAWDGTHLSVDLSTMGGDAIFGLLHDLALRNELRRHAA